MYGRRPVSVPLLSAAVAERRMSRFVWESVVKRRRRRVAVMPGLSHQLLLLLLLLLLHGINRRYSTHL